MYEYEVIVFCRSMYSGWYLWTLHSFWCLVSVSSSSCRAFGVKGWHIQIPGNFFQFLDNLLFKFVHVLYYVDLNSTSFYSAAFCPFHIGQFTVILLSLEEAVSAWLIFPCSCVTLCLLYYIWIIQTHLTIHFGDAFDWLCCMASLSQLKYFVCHARIGR